VGGFLENVQNLRWICGCECAGVGELNVTQCFTNSKATARDMSIEASKHAPIITLLYLM